MAEKKIKWTDQQKRAIIARGSDVLVTASAGTGKTAVLSGRCVNIVSDKSVCPDVRNILVLTFTEAAAEQMRSRIAERLKDAFEAKPDSHLRYQLMLLQAADISTIHSFCKRLITEHFYKLGLDPTFSVIDADEQKLLKTESLEKTIDWAWQQSNLRAALEQLLYRRDLSLPRTTMRGTNEGFLAKIIQISDFLDGVISRQNWCERAARLADVTNPLNSALGQKQKKVITDRLQNILARIEHAIKLYESESTDGSWATKWNETFVEPVTKYIKLIKSGRWEKFSEEIRNYQRPSRFEYKPRGLSGLIAEIIRSTAESAKKSFDELFDFAILNPDYLDRLSGSVGLQTRVLIELIKKFDGLYGHAKRTLNCLDFADLEHKALELLTAEDSTEDQPKPSETALMLREKYKHIFVDEYQDINSVQQRMLQMLSPGGNILEVGDVKQSIYAFRGAQPDIFLERLKLASTEPENAPNGLRVDLNVNFRSAKGILDFVNRIFSRIMTPSFTKIDYDESAQLRPAPKDESKDRPLNGSKPVVEFHILDEAGKDDDVQDEKNGLYNDAENLNLVTSRQRQAAMIARCIRQMVGADTGKPEFQIYDKQQDTFRDVQYRDIVVLMRSLAKKANDYVEVLRLAGVPVSCQATAGYFQATEISDVLCLLKVLDNPQPDIELAAVLRSPFFKVSDTELVKIKILNRESQQRRNYYDCMLQYCSCGTDLKLAAKLKGIIAQLERWRTIARRGSLADLVWQVYRETGFLSFVSALPNGQARRANLLKLHDRAIQFEGFASSAGIPSLTRFVEFIEKLQEAGQDWAPAEPQASAGNAVRILSVHKSKGLEFPVVFLAELDSPFNKTDIQADILTDADDTLGLQIIDRRSNSKLSSLAHEVIAEQKLSTALAEEMRILYVATTRARERLILTASQKRTNCGQILSNGFFFGAQPIPDWQLRSCNSPLEWVLYALSEQKSLHDAFGTGLAEQALDDNLFSLKLYDQAQLKQLSEFVIKLKQDKSRGGSRLVPQVTALPPSSASVKLSQLKKSLAWQYHFGDACILPAKSSVTQLTHRNDEYIKFDYSRALARQPAALLAAEDQRVAASSAAWGWFGTATHLIISQLDLAEPVTEEAIEKTKEKLLADNAVNPAVAESINIGSLMRFFESDLGKMIFEPENTVLREWPFTFALPASEWQDFHTHDAMGGSLKRSLGMAPTDSLRASHFTSGGSLIPMPSCESKKGDGDGQIRDTIIIQGIIDMLLRTPKGLVIIDFKTDNVTAKIVSERAELYRQQLNLYSRAASAILKTESIAKWLYFLTPACPFELR